MKSILMNYCHRACAATTGRKARAPEGGMPWLTPSTPQTTAISSASGLISAER